MRALSATNVMGNRIGKEQLVKLQEIMRAKPSLVSLCGIADDATGAGLSGIGMGADGAVVLASELPAKGALLHLNLANNRLNNGVRGKWISGSVGQWWKALPRRSRGQTQATRGVNDPPQGQLACPVLLPVC